jgi:hypothetical protein
MYDTEEIIIGVTLLEALAARLSKNKAWLRTLYLAKCYQYKGSLLSG